MIWMRFLLPARVSYTINTTSHDEQSITDTYFYLANNKENSPLTLCSAAPLRLQLRRRIRITYLRTILCGCW